MLENRKLCNGGCRVARDVCPEGNHERGAHRHASSSRVGTTASDGKRGSHRRSAFVYEPQYDRQYRETLQRADLLSGEPDKLPELWLLKEAVRSCARKSLEKEDGLIFAFDADYICIMGSNHEYAVG